MNKGIVHAMNGIIRYILKMWLSLNGPSQPKIIEALVKKSTINLDFMIYTIELDYVCDQNTESNDKRLASLDAIDAGINIDSIGAKNGQHSHVDVVENAQINTIA